jgi:histidinol-phosphate aminotransferase
MTTPRKSIINAKGYEIPLYAENFRLKLDLNENVMGPSPKVIEALRSLTEDDIKFYPAYGTVLDKLAAYNGVKREMILPANGCDEVIGYVFDTFVEQEDTILAVQPSFVMSKIYAGTLGCDYKELPYTEKWEFPVDEVIKSIDAATKLIIVTSPNNPTGEAISRTDLMKVLTAADGRYVLVDETYVSYADGTFIDLLNQYPNLLIARSMSKDFALAGLRFGYLIASEENIGYIKRIIRPYCVNNLAVKAACAALDDIEHLNYCVSQVKQSRKLLAEGLKPLAKKIYPSDANFVLADFGEKAEFIYKKLLKSGIKVKNFGDTPQLENCLRISLPNVENTKFILETLAPRDLIIFDMDGVLADTSNSYRLAIRGAYEAFSGKTLTSEKVQEAKNRGGLNNDWDLTAYLLEEEGISVDFSELIDKFQQLYWANGGDGFIRNEKLLISQESLAKLAEKYDLAVFTGRPKQEALFALENWGIDKYFSPVITMEDPPRGLGKPNPWGVNEILRITGGKKAYYLGDTVDDMFAARQAGVVGIGVLPPQDKSETLKRALLAHGAAEVLENTEHLVQLLQKFELATEMNNA